MKIHTDNDHVELETALQEFVLDLLGNGIETNVRSRTDFFSISGSHFFVIIR